MLKTFCSLFLLISITCVLPAQQAPSSISDGMQAPGQLDCSDPQQATSLDCAGQHPSEVTPFNSQTRMPVSGSANSPSPGVPEYSDFESRTGSDLESRTRQQFNQRQGQQLRLPPEPLTEFQKFVASTTGQILPIFGANLFRTVPSTFAPLDMAPVPPDYIIGPGDELRVRVWGQVNFQANITVDRAGEIYIPVSQVGPVHVAGLPYSDLNAHLREAIGRTYRNFDLLADIGQIRAIQVYVAGEARRTGVFTVSSLSTLIDALFASGGPSVQGSLRHIRLRRGDQEVTDFDLYSFLVHGDKSKDVKLLAGDVIFIPPVGPQVAVVGSVRNPGIYELTANEPLANALANAGGVSALASQARVSIERIETHSGRHAMEVAYDESGLAAPLAEGDLVRVFSIVPKYNETVTLRGNIANPGRFAWHPGMRISDLIPDKESLITRNYWWKRAQLGLPAPEFEPTSDFADMKQPVDNQPVSMLRQMTASIGPSSASELLPDQGSFGSQLSQSGTQLGQQSQLNQQGNQGNRSRPTQANTSLAAQQMQQPYGRLAQNVTRNEVSLPDPQIDWDYAHILRLDPSTLKTSLIPFDLGKLVLEHDAAQDLELQAGDVVSIFSEADIRLPIAQQTKFVKLDGEFVHAGLYTVKPGETLQELVSRAGGLTPNAYLYGAEFTRESTRVLQQARLDEYLRTLDLRIQRSNLALSTAPYTSAQDAGGSLGTQLSERELIARLRQIRASGRIVFEFKPGINGTSEIPKVELEDGDRFVIPPVPATVNVVGAVNDQNSFLYMHGREVGTYLKKAGGLTKDADRKRSFVIRANGEVAGYDASRTAWTSNFNSLKIYPGDTIVIPEKTFKPSTMRSVLEWSQMFSQFALGAASISVIR
jgi:protein involved in polysaccharide export with SLBB domain